MRFALVVILLALAGPALSAPEIVDGKNAVILDGDTVAFGSERIRILDIEAPGISEPECEREEIFALRSRQRLAELIRTGPVTIQRTGRDSLGRTLARLYLSDGREIAAILVAEGLALDRQDGPEWKAARRRHWCD
jgi:endonuclease YncB( thermonuclease family)